jgi:hypothetical protein
MGTPCRLVALNPFERSNRTHLPKGDKINPMSPLSLTRSLASVLAAAAILVPAASFGQGDGMGTLFFKTKVGSFKLLGLTSRPAEGKVQVTFTGTMLINKNNDADPKIVTTGNLKKEYDDKGQVAYHGTGSITIEGKFTAIQWFGRDMSARWDGFGIARLVGEFDKDLKTGTYCYIQNTDDVRDWGTQLREITNPPKPGDYIIKAVARPIIKPVPRKGG